MKTPTIRRDTRVFISAVSRELGSVRKLVKKGLEDNDYHAVEQDNFPPDYRQLVDKLRERIASCDAVIHIAGHCYGAEPQQRPDDAPRRSYTQMEYDLTVELGKPAYVFLTADGFPVDPHDPEDEERTRLQAEHRQRLTGTGQDYSRPATREELDQKIRSLQLKVEALQEELTHVDQHVTSTSRRLGRVLATVVLVSLLILGATLFVQHQQRQQLERQAQEQLAQQQERDKQERERKRQEAERLKQDQERQAAEGARLQAQKIDPEIFLREIRAAAEKQIKALPQEKGRWSKVAEIERQRDVQLSRLDELVRFIQTTLQGEPSEVFQRALEIQQDTQHGGSDEALKYLESKREQTLATAKVQAEQLKASKAEVTARQQKLQQTLQTVALEAELLETNLNWPEALKRRLEVAENALDWFDARNQLGMLLLKLTRFRDAELHLRAAVELATKPDNEAQALNNLAQLLKATNRLAAAEPLMRRALAIDEQSYGAERLVVATHLNNLAMLLQATNRMEEAEPLMRRALVLNEQSYGAERAFVAIRLNNLGDLLKNTNRLVEAERLMRRALAIDEQSYGAENPHVARDLNNLAVLLQDTNRLPEAEPLIRRALAIDKQSYGAEHPEVAADLNNLAQLLRATNRLPEAEPLMRRALVVDEQSYGAEDPNVAIALNNLVGLLKATNRLAKTEPLMRRCVAIVHQFGRKTGHEHPEMKTVLNNYRDILQSLKLSDDEIAHRIEDATDIAGTLKPIVPEVEQLLGPAKSVAEVLAALDRQYKADGKPAVYFLPPNQPIVPHLENLLQPNPASLNAAGVNAFRRGDHATAVAYYDESLKLLADKPDKAAISFSTRMNRAAALRELGEAEQGRDELQKVLANVTGGDAITALAKGRARYHLALCEWRLDDRDAARREAEESLKEYGDDADSAALKKQTEQLLADLKENKPLPPLAKIVGAATAAEALEQARTRFQARADLTTLPLTESADPLLDKMLGPARSTKEVLEMLDEEYRKGGKPRVWFLPLNEPIAPHLDELLGPIPDAEEEK